MHHNAYKPGYMVYAYIKAQTSEAALQYAMNKNIDLSCVVRVSEIKIGELYMMHIVGHLSVVESWFQEPNEAPYPYGTCLLYSATD